MRQTVKKPAKTRKTTKKPAKRIIGPRTHLQRTPHETYCGLSIGGNGLSRYETNILRSRRSMMVKPDQMDCGRCRKAAGI